MSGLIKAAVGAFTGGTSVWLPYVIAGGIFLALGAGLWIQTDRLHAAQAETKAALAERDSAKHELGIAQSDVTRWTAHSADQDAEIASLNKQLAQHVADAAAADQAAQETADAQAAAVADLQAQLKRMKDQARAHPDQVRPLGPIVLDVLRGNQAGAAAPAAASH